MISIFLHLLVLAYGTVNLAGTALFMPLASIGIWFFVTFAVLVHLLPAYVDDCRNRLYFPSFMRVNSAAQWLVTGWIILLHAVASPVSLAFPKLEILSQTIPMVVSLLLYVGIARVVYFEVYRLFWGILDENQSSNDFFRARMTIPILFFPPIMLWMLLEDLTVGGLDQINEIKMMVVAPFFFILLYLLAPKLFNWAWRAEDSDDAELVNTIREISLKAETPVSGVKIWDTFNEPVPNAAVAGLSSRFRFVYITRFLLELFSPAQVRSVVAHELAHLRLGHVSTYMIYSINLVLISTLFKLVVLVYYPAWWADSALAVFAEMALFIGVFAVTFTALARFCEHQADAFAAEITDADSLAGGLETLQGMVMAPPWFIPSWLLTHPEIQYRISRIRQNFNGGINKLVFQAATIRKALLSMSLIMFLLALGPANAVLSVSRLHDAVQAGNSMLAVGILNSLPVHVRDHPLVISETGKLAAANGSWTFATLIAAEASWGVELISRSQILHHAGPPEVAFDLKVMKFILKSLDLR